MPQAAGLTLLELLIALTLLVLVLTLSVPSILTTLDRRQFNEMRAQVLTYMTLVRAEAQLHGEVLAVYYEPQRAEDDAIIPWDDPVGFGGLTPGDVEALSAPPAGAVDKRQRPARLVARPYELVADAASGSTTSGRRRVGAYDDEPERRSKRWSTLRFTDAFRMSKSLPTDWLERTGFGEALLGADGMALEGPGAAASARPAALIGDPDEEVEPIILAVFFPDGTAVTPGERVYLVHDQGNVAELRLNRWTGQAELRELTREPLETSEEDAEELDEAYDPFDEENIMRPTPNDAPATPSAPAGPANRSNGGA